ncbi:hypothetical protein [Leptolyngbya sp. FACHB-17]|uniref:hypothetical protein n=1 Tax=unclassified Leptolyngbya TaxID=2650499 RepID=UPI0016804B01|nr:hypothetical protein [Leptolyngbya sp. FACHB-17]MBD2078790.1 hypothetical protein [Leptolyngbya sp. FACHB-17]
MTTQINTNGMDEIFANYLAIVLGERPAPRKRGVNSKLFQDSLSLYVNYSGARFGQLLEMVKRGDSNARKLLISAAVSGWKRQAESALFTQSEGLVSV